ncbi:MAG: guanylate kinase [Candidatus Omnitrophota bacterium]|nr:MAG: guanylate kinase [Candidatus Omnitrophota bacterium]
MKRQTKIFIISGPGGAGKTTLVNRLFRREAIKNHFVRSVSFTTRKRRANEKEGRDYCFVSQDKFRTLQRKHFFLESQKVLNDYYGTPKYFYTQALTAKKDLILCIDVKGGIYLKRNLKLGKIVTIFISAPNKEELYRRLKRRVEKNDLIRKRLRLAKKELQCAQRYDYLIINRDVEESFNILETILLAEKFRR